MRLVDADELLKGRTDHEMISTHLIFNAPTVDVLDKIRGDIFDEIKNRYTEVRDKSMIQWCSGKVSGLKRTLEIIDKYR